MQFYMGTMGALPFSAAVRKLQAVHQQIENADSRPHTPIVVTILCDVPHPWESLVATLFDDLEVADLDARYCEVWDLELHRNRCSFINFLLCAQLVSGFLTQIRLSLDNSPPLTLGKPKWARIRNSRLPASCFIFQTNADLSGAY